MNDENENEKRGGRKPPENTRITYQYQYRRCNKPSCVCKKDLAKRHGPYWYAYWYDAKTKKLCSAYIGKTPPSAVAAGSGEAATTSAANHAEDDALLSAELALVMP